MYIAYKANGYKESSNADLAIYMQNYHEVKSAHTENFDRIRRNMRAYQNDLVGRQLAHSLELQNREEQNFNIMKPFIQGHLGNVFSNWFDPKFVAGEDDPIDAVEALQRVYYKQKEQYNYKASAYSSLENGYICQGIEEIYIERPDSNPRNWGIAFRPRRPDMVFFDPDVHSDRISRDSKQAHLRSFLTVEQMCQLFPHKREEVTIRAAYNEKDENKDYHYDNINVNRFDNIHKTQSGRTYEVVEWMHIKQERVVKRMLMNGMQVPETGYGQGTQEDAFAVQQWGARNGIEVSEDMMICTCDIVPVLYVTTFCPQLMVELDNRMDYRQLDGHLPLYSWGFLQKNGISLGIIDYLWDTQQDFNKRELGKTKILTQTPVVGKPFVSRELFESDKAFREAVKDFTDSSKPLVLSEDAPPNPQNYFGILPGTQVPNAVLQDESFKLMLAERLAMMPPVLQGRSEKSADSGLALGRKVIESQVMLNPEMESIIQYENDKAEDWVKLAVKLFGDKVNMNRAFQGNDPNKQVVINEVQYQDGEVFIAKDISQIKRVNITITQTKENDYQSQARRETAVASLQVMMPNENNQLTRAAIEYSLATNIEMPTDEQKDMLEQAAKKQLEIANNNADLTLMGQQLQKQQMAMQMGQGQQPMPQQPGQPAQPQQASAGPPQPQGQEQPLPEPVQ